MQDDVSVLDQLANETTEFYDLRQIGHSAAISLHEVLDWHILPSK